MCQCPICQEFLREYGRLIDDMIGKSELALQEYLECYEHCMMLIQISHVKQLTRSTEFRKLFANRTGGMSFDALIGE